MKYIKIQLLDKNRQPLSFEERYRVKDCIKETRKLASRYYDAEYVRIGGVVSGCVRELKEFIKQK